MKNDRMTFGFYIVLSTFALSASSAFSAEDFIGRAVSVTGKVLVRGEGTGSQMTFLKAGDKLFKGTILNTGSGGTVKLLMTDRTILDLGPSSLFKVNDYEIQTGNVGDRKVDLSLDYGTVRASVNEKISSNKGKFTIRTKAATMGVRGTEFVVNAALPVKNFAGETTAPPKTSLTVMHGKVEVADVARPSAAPVAVTPGFQFAKTGDGPGAVEQLKPQEVAQIKTDAFQKDMTFLQAISFDAETGKDSNKGNERKDKSSEKSGEKTADIQGGQQTLESIGMSVETQSNDKTLEQPTIADLNLPGTFSSDIPQIRPIDQLNGRLVNLRVIIKAP